MIPYPPIIHQIHLGRNSNYLQKYNKNIDELKKINTNCVHMLWDDDSIQELIIRNHPTFYNCYKRLSLIDKSDFARYVIMYEYGGFYFDLDVECHRAVCDFFTYNQIYFRLVRGTNTLPTKSTVENFDPYKYNHIFSSENYLKNGQSYVNNYFLASKPKSEFWLNLLNEIICCIYDGCSNYMMLTKCLEKYKPIKTLILPSFYFGWGSYMKTPRPDWVISSHNTTKGNRKVLLCSHALNMGGAERWIISMSKSLPNVAGILVEERGTLDEVVKKHTHIFYKMEDALQTQPDIGIIWGNCSIGLEKHIPIIAVSHGTSDIPFSKHVCLEMEKRTKYLYSVSESANNSWTKEGKVIYNGVDVERALPISSRENQRKQWNLTDNDICVLYLGRISPEKRVQKLIDNFILLPKKYKLFIVGPNHSDMKLIGNDRTTILDGVEHPGDVYAASDVVVSASETEGLSLGMVETWIAAKPLVICNHTSAKEILNKFGDHFTTIPVEFTKKQFASAVKTAYNTPNTQLENTRSLALNEFNSCKMIQKWTQEINQLNIYE
jgi:glycosyltransferase involved in cell wall biosynthesis